MSTRRASSSRVVWSLAVLAVGGGALGWWHQAARPEMSWSRINAAIARQFPEVPTIETGALAAWLHDSTRVQPLVIDTRTRAEFAVSHLPGARHAESADAVMKLWPEVSADRPVVVYCSVGWRSAAVADAVRQSGHTNIRNLRGSIFQWANEGRPLERHGAPARVVHPFDQEWGALLSRDLWPADFIK